MLAIRQDQLEALREAPLQRFQDQMAAHLARFSPPLVRTLGDAQLRLAVRFGIGRAGGHGFRSRGPVRLYLESMLLLGSHFDTDPLYPWAAEILGQATIPEMERARSLYAAIREYRRLVAGPDDALTLRALRRIRARAGEELPFPPEALPSAFPFEMYVTYPEKLAQAGPAATQALIRSGLDEAARHGFTTTRHCALIIVLMLAFGHGCAKDPLYPWIGRTLGDERITDARARAARLEAKALTWLDGVLAGFEGAPT